MAESDIRSPDAAISGPAKVSIALRSPRGPLARSGWIDLPVKRLAFVNAGIAPVALARATIDPLQDEQRGQVATGAGPGLHVDITGPMTAESGTPVIVTLAGTAPARPGSYLSTLRLYPQAGPPLAVPIHVAVAASPAWGIGLTLLGLSVVSAMAGLDEQGAVATKLRDALHKRGAAQLFVAEYPNSDGTGDVAAMDAAYEAAIIALSRPRSAGLVDHRLEDAAVPLAEADRLAASLRHAADGLSPADALVKTANIAWQALQPHLKALVLPAASDLPPAPGKPAVGDGAGVDITAFGSRLDAMLSRLRERLVGAPARWLEAELSAQITRLKLVAASGDIEDARLQARAVQTAMRRAAHSLAAGQRLVMLEGAQMAYMLGTVAETQRATTDPDIPAASRADIASKLEAARTMLADGAELRRLVDVGRAVNEAASALTLAAARAEEARVTAATALASAATDTPAVDAAVATAQADPDRSPARKTAHLQSILDAWRSTIGAASDPEGRPTLLASVDVIAAALDRGDMPGVGEAYRALTQAWAAFATQRITLAGAQALKPYCDSYAARLQRRLGFIDQELRWEEPDARSVEWDRRRDHLRLALERVAPGGECLAALLALDKDVNGLAGDIGAAAADTAGVDAAVRSDAMAVYGVSASTGPRVLAPYTDTPSSELFVDRPLTISVGNLDPAWGGGTMVSVQFGDGSPPLSLDAETLRRSPPRHVYTRPLAAHVSALAADALTADGRAIGTPLGQGAATLLIAPAPDSRARTLADRFLSARFALALIVALVIYSWRFLSRDRVFGACGFDYAEAFALGFAVNAAIAELPAILARL